MDVPPVIAAPMRRRRGWWPAMTILGAAGIGLVLFLFNPSQYGFYPRCMLYVTTGLYCPGCGATRAAYQLLHGHILTAMHYNVLFVLSVPFGAFYSLRRVVCWTNGRPAPSIVLQPKWLVAGGIVLFLFTVLRNIPIAPFTLLAPPQ